jgi:hypothetical protein
MEQDSLKLLELKGCFLGLEGLGCSWKLFFSEIQQKGKEMEHNEVVSDHQLILKKLFCQNFLKKVAGVWRNLWKVY